MSDPRAEIEAASRDALAASRRLTRASQRARGSQRRFQAAFKQRSKRPAESEADAELDRLFDHHARALRTQLQRFEDFAAAYRYMLAVGEGSSHADADQPAARSAATNKSGGDHG